MGQGPQSVDLLFKQGFRHVQWREKSVVVGSQRWIRRCVSTFLEKNRLAGNNQVPTIRETGRPLRWEEKALICHYRGYNMITSIELYLKDYKETCFPLKTACHLPPKVLSRQQVMKHASTSHSIRCSVRKNTAIDAFYMGCLCQITWRIHGSQMWKMTTCFSLKSSPIFAGVLILGWPHIISRVVDFNFF